MLVLRTCKYPQSTTSNNDQLPRSAKILQRVLQRPGHKTTPNAEHVTYFAGIEVLAVQWKSKLFPDALSGSGGCWWPIKLSCILKVFSKQCFPFLSFLKTEVLTEAFKTLNFMTWGLNECS